MNKRHFTRYVIRCAGYFLDSAFHRIDFRVNNISANGMNVATDKEIKAAGDALTIHFDPEGLSLPQIKELKGSIVTKKKTGAGFNYGIRFLGLSYMEYVELDEYLRYIQNNPSRMRFRPAFYD